MKTTLSLTLALAIAALAAPTWAAQDDAHDAHHPAGSVSAPATKAAPSKAPQKMACMGMQMQTMREMHAKMIAVKAPEERNALMAEQMKVMQDGMGMMKEMSMSGMGGMKGERAGYEPKMEMMQGMMQMMMDRLSAVDTSKDKQP